MRKSIFLLLFAVLAIGTQAKSWKIGPSSVNGMDYTSINSAMNSSNIVAGDTLYLDQFYTENETQIVTKSVVIIGNGYDRTLTDEQAVAYIPSLVLRAKNVTVMSVSLYNVEFNNEGCLLDRCYLSYAYVTTNAGRNSLRSCYIITQVMGNDGEGTFDIENCLFYSGNDICIRNLNNGIINHNTIIHFDSNYNYATFWDVKNSVITNNIVVKLNRNTTWIFQTESHSQGCGNSIEHNVWTADPLPLFPANKCIKVSNLADVFVAEGTYSDYYRLAEKSAALGYATDGTDCGCHGGMFGCPSGGRPQYIPYFSKVVVSPRTENGKLPVSVSVKIQDE